MADGRNLKKSIKKLPYLLIHLTDFDEIWHSNTSGTPTSNQPLKFPKFENPKWRTAAILKKSPYLPNHLTDFDDIWRGNALGPTHQSQVTNLRF